MDAASNLMHGLLDYVLEQSKVVDPRGFTLAASRGLLKTMDQLSGLPGVDFDIKVEGDHIWMRVERLEALPPPPVSEAFRGLISASTSPTSAPPVLDEKAIEHRLALNATGKPPEQAQQEAAVFRNTVGKALAQYTLLWQAWSAGEKPRRQSIDLYGELFSLKQQLESEETAKPQELVWGMGIAAWRLRDEAGSIDYQYPLLTQAMELNVDEASLAITVRPRGVEPRFEFDAFSACQLMSAPDVEKTAKHALTQAGDRTPTPFDPGSFEHLLKMVAGNLHEKGRYLNGQRVPPTPAEDLLVTDAWVMLSRPRAHNYLHEDIQRLKNRITDGAVLPAGAAAFVTPPSDEKINHEPVRFRGLSGGGGGGTGKPLELFFPLPYNHEQVTIIEQLQRSDGVAVQGPPGTGKTHTIANIVCHYLATGRKVLVTSKGEQALEVLQSKIPVAVRPLTVALLSGDREGMRQFQNSIEAITHNLCRALGKQDADAWFDTEGADQFQVTEQCIASYEGRALVLLYLEASMLEPTYGPAGFRRGDERERAPWER